MSTPSTFTVPELAPWQVEIGGVVLGHGTRLPIGEIEGLGAPTVRAQDVDNPTEDGTFPAQDLYGPRTVRIEAGIKTPGDPIAAAELLARLQRAVDAPAARTRAGGLAVLRARWPGHRTRRLYGRLRRMEATSTANAVHGWIPLDIEFAAMDPRWHADESSRLGLGLDQVHDHPAPDTILYGSDCGPAKSAARPGWITNDGDAAAWPTLQISGPVTNPRIWNTVTGRTLELRVVLRAGERIDIETRPGTRWVLRDGTTNAANALTPASRLDQFIVPPGRSEIRWTGDDPTGTCRLDVTWRSAYTAL